MSLINQNRKYCYRITHIQNLHHILEKGIVAKNFRPREGAADRKKYH